MYYAHAYRWGQTNNPQHHVVAAGPNLENVKDKARQYCCDRGGKYGVAVYKLPEDEDMFYVPELVGYYPSLLEEPKPFEDFEHEVVLNIGMTLFRAVQTGQISVPRADDSSTLMHIDIPEPLPQWLVAKLSEAILRAEAWLNYDPDEDED